MKRVPTLIVIEISGGSRNDARRDRQPEGEGARLTFYLATFLNVVLK